MEKPRLLFLTSQLPYPPVSGGTIKSWRLLEHLCRSFEVTLFTMLKGADSDNYGTLTSKVALTPASKGFLIARARTPWNFLRSLFESPTLNVFRNSASAMSNAMTEALGNNDVILVDHLEMTGYIPEPSPLPMALHQHNAEYVMWQRSTTVTHNFMERLVLRMESARVRRFEARSCKRADIILAAPNDQTELERLGVDRTKFRTTYHLGDDAALNAPQLQFTATRKSLMYVGTLSWPANSDGLLWFLREVWPELKAMHADLEFDILGQGAVAELQQLVNTLEDVRLHGFVQDLEPYYRQSRVFVAPLRFGSGTKVKVVTAMYRGIPCVTTSIGVEGISLADGTEVHVADHAADMVERVNLLLNDRGAWENMRDASRQKAAKDLSWDSMLENHARDLHVLAANHG